MKQQYIVRTGRATNREKRVARNQGVTVIKLRLIAVKAVAAAGGYDAWLDSYFSNSAEAVAAVAAAEVSGVTAWA